MKIYARDGKALDVDLTLQMAREHIDLCEGEPYQHGVERGLALALEAALVTLQGYERIIVNSVTTKERASRHWWRKS